MNTNDEAVLSTARLNFGQKVEQDTKAKVQAEEAQQEAMTAEAEEQPEATVEAEPDTENGNTADLFSEEASEPVSDGTTIGQVADAGVVDETINEAEAVNETREALAVQAQSEGKTVEELVAERDRIDAEVKAKQNALKASVIDQIKTVVNTYDISTEELVEALGGLKSKRKGIKAKPKYKDPATGVIWSGRGKEPAWIKGQDRTKFLIPEA